jgi:hypothetical protein
VISHADFAMSCEILADTYGQERRQIRDTLLELLELLQSCRGSVGIQRLLEEISAQTAPYFRYANKSRCLDHIQTFEKEHFRKLLSDDEFGIRALKMLQELISAEFLARHDTLEPVKLVQSPLFHVNECEALSLMVEKLRSHT